MRSGSTDWARFAGAGAVADQVRFEREWAALRAYAAERGVRLIGDVPIYVAPGSADQRAHPELFQRRRRGGRAAGRVHATRASSGATRSTTGRRCGASGYRWWIERLRRTFELFDLARIDHFRGFVAYWAVPAKARDALGGRWKRGPGRALFDAARARARASCR